MAYETIPDPARQVLAGGVLKAFDLIEVVVVEAIVERLERTRDVRKIDDPARLVIDRTFDVDCHAVRVAVESGALVTFRDIREAVCCLESELLEDLHS